MALKRTLISLAIGLYSLTAFSQETQWPMALKGQSFLIIARGNFSNYYYDDTIDGVRNIHLQLIYDSTFFKEVHFPDTTAITRIAGRYVNFFGYLMLGDSAKQYPAFHVEFYEQVSADSMHLRHSVVATNYLDRPRDTLNFDKRMYLLREIMPMSFFDQLYPDSLVVHLVPWRHRTSVVSPVRRHESIHKYLNTLGIVLVDDILFTPTKKEVHLYFHDTEPGGEIHFCIIRPTTREFRNSRDKFIGTGRE